MTRLMNLPLGEHLISNNEIQTLTSNFFKTVSETPSRESSISRPIQAPDAPTETAATVKV